MQSNMLTVAHPGAACYKPRRLFGKDFKVLKSLYTRTLELSNHRHALWVLVIVAFVESSIFPIPPDILLIPMIIAAPSRAWKIALLCTVASVMGGLAGYGIGMFLFQELGQPLLELYGYSPKFLEFQKAYNEWGAWAVFIAGVTPFPYKVITILSGVTALDLVVFIVASLMARGFRFFLIAALIWKFGLSIREFIEAHLGIVFTIFCTALVGGFLAIKYFL